MVGQSEVEPMIMPTCGRLIVNYSILKGADSNIKNDRGCTATPELN